MKFECERPEPEHRELLVPMRPLTVTLESDEELFWLSVALSGYLSGTDGNYPTDQRRCFISELNEKLISARSYKLIDGYPEIEKWPAVVRSPGHGSDDVSQPPVVMRQSLKDSARSIVRSIGLG